MELHDGFQMIEAIEYQPINQLSLENIAPGCKVRCVILKDNLYLLILNTVRRINILSLCNVIIDRIA